jgi:hypothetical protein
MKLTIDHLTDNTGWTIDTHGSVTQITDKSFVAGLNANSLMIKFDERDTATRKAIKNISPSINVTGYDNLILSVTSQNYKSNEYKTTNDFYYKLKINGTNEFFLPMPQTMCDITIGITGITSISKIEITALHSNTDYIFISEMVAEKEELPLDVLNGIKESIEYFLLNDYGDGLLIDTITGLANDTQIDLTGKSRDFLDKYSCVKIKDLTNSETHMLDDNDENKYYLNANYGSGKSLVRNYTNANLYLTFPVTINPSEIDVYLPGIAVWGIDQEMFLRGAKQDTEFDTWTTTGVKARKEGQLLKHKIQIDIEARQFELIDKMSRSIRKWISRQELWVNGRKHEIILEGTPIEQEIVTGIDILPKLQYNFIVESKENIFDRVNLAYALADVITVDKKE